MPHTRQPAAHYNDLDDEDNEEDLDDDDDNDDDYLRIPLFVQDKSSHEIMIVPPAQHHRLDMFHLRRAKKKNASPEVSFFQLFSELTGQIVIRKQ